ncbi:MAG: AAA family ATPase [Atopobiaceae bacterium]|jgi:5-methylcytosine-specific restriction protein B
MADSRYTWIGFYTELADRLLDYRDDRQRLISELQETYQGIGIKFPKLDSMDAPADIDPFTVFGLFNKGITEANRKKIISGIADRFGVAASQPQDFTGLPVLNNLNATFYAFSDDDRRGEKDIDNLWLVFEAGLALSSKDDEKNRGSFIEAYNAAAGQFALGWKLTMGLYWVRPYDFINLDSRNRWFMGDAAATGADLADVVPKERDAALHDGARYLDICDAIKGRLGTSECAYKTFPELSGAAFAESERVNKEKKASEKAAEKEAEENALGDADVETAHCWLYAPGEGASMWDDFYERGVMGLGWSELGNLESYASKEEMRVKLQEVERAETSQKNSAHAVWQFAHDIKPGDVVYAKRGRSEIIGRGVVTGKYEYDASGGHYPNTRSVSWSQKGSWHYDGMFAMKTLTDITDYTELVAKIGALFDDADEEPAVLPAAAEHPAYGREDFLSEVFMDEAQYDTLVGVLRVKKNVILQGAPGVGKTFAAKRLAYSMMGVKDPDRVMMVQFHQSYSYEDFIEGYRPSADGFELAKGSFYTFCKRAADDADNDYFFIIDEINRGNLSKIFGELFMLIENDKRGPKNKLQLLYSRELFYVPSNVYLIGMMNTADRSLAMLDYALRRRFAFFDLKPGFATDGFTAYRESVGSKKLNSLIAAVERLNAAIAEDDTLGEGFCIGHSYFCGLKPEDATDAKLAAIVDYELVPMLREYWFDDPAKVREWSEALRKAVK